MTTLRTLSGSVTLDGDAVVLEHEGAAVPAAKKVHSPLRVPLVSVERVEHVPQTAMSGGHLRVHLVGDDRPPAKPMQDARVAQLPHLRTGGLRNVEGFLSAVQPAVRAAEPKQRWSWPAQPAPHHKPADQTASRRSAASGTTAVEAPRRTAREERAQRSAGDLEHRRTMRLLRVSEFAMWVQLLALLLPIVVIVVVFIVVIVIVL